MISPYDFFFLIGIAILIVAVMVFWGDVVLNFAFWLAYDRHDKFRVLSPGFWDGPIYWTVSMVGILGPLFILTTISVVDWSQL